MSPDTVSPIRRARHRAGKTLRYVAAALAVTERTVMRWELGQTKPDAETLIRLARLFRRRPEDLVMVA